MSTANYITITGASRATAARDVNDLMQKKIFTRRGEKNSARYFLDDKWTIVNYYTIAVEERRFEKKI